MITVPPAAPTTTVTVTVLAVVVDTGAVGASAPLLSSLFMSLLTADDAETATGDSADLSPPLSSPLSPLSSPGAAAVVVSVVLSSEAVVDPFEDPVVLPSATP